jgi:hypothetical protein
MLQSPRSAGSGSVCTSPPARPTRVSDSVAVDRGIVRGSAIPAPPPCPFRTWNGLPHLSIPVLASSDERNVNRSCSCVDGCRRVTVFEKRGGRDFGLQDARSLLRTPTIQYPTATYAEIGPSRRRSASSPGTQTQTQTPRLWSGELTETLLPARLRNQVLRRS